MDYASSQRTPRLRIWDGISWYARAVSSSQLDFFTHYIKEYKFVSMTSLYM